MPGLDLSFFPFISWFKANGGTLDERFFGLTTFTLDEGGRGAVALQDIPESHVLFSIPRPLTLSTRSSRLPTLFGIERWRRPAPAGFGLDKGWTGLILCMMWEEANHGPWAAYLASLPSRFDTPMFWSQEELTELKGTSVVEKLGKADAENEYLNKLLPVIQSRRDIFPPHHIPFHYTLEKFHIHGSRILSRSFTVDHPASITNGAAGVDESDGHPATHTESSHAMDVDEVPQESSDANSVNGEDTDDEDDDDDGIVSMVPMADMLNARYGSENAKLFYEENELRMMTTKPIKAGDQIFNTYNDLPNAELLRRYGHVDLLPLPSELGLSIPDNAQGLVCLGNPGDVVELRADIVVDAIVDASLKQTPGPGGSGESLREQFKARIDWWLEIGGDDGFVFELPPSLPSDLVSLVRLLLYDAEWEKAQQKEKPPKATLDKDVLTIVSDIVQRRINMYDGTIEDDETILASPSGLSLHKKQAVVVRLGEKRILRCAQEHVCRELERIPSNSSRSAGVKRRGGDAGGATGKKRKV